LSYSYVSQRKIAQSEVDLPLDASLQQIAQAMCEVYEYLHAPDQATIPISKENIDPKSIFSESDKQELILYSPCLGVLEKIQKDLVKLDSLTWREFEELVAELLEREGYEVKIGSGSKDEGVDIVATKFDSNTGFFKSIWQAKKPSNTNNKVGINVVRELADTRVEMKATKGIIVTTSFLTRGALERITRDRYLLGKIERDELEQWIQRVLYKSP
jgi:restriction system protein